MIALHFVDHASLAYLPFLAAIPLVVAWGTHRAEKRERSREVRVWRGPGA